MDIHSCIALLGTIIIIWMLYVCKCRKEGYRIIENPIEQIYERPHIPQYANVNVAPYSGFNYDVNLAYYYR